MNIKAEYLEKLANIGKIRSLYVEKQGSVGLGADDLDTLMLAVLDNLKGEDIIFTQTGALYGKIRQGFVVSVKGRKVHIKEMYHKRRLDIKNLIIYHPSLLAALTVI